MTKQEAIDLIKLRLGSRDDADLDALIVAELAQSQAVLEGTAPYPWFCLTENKTTTLDPDENRVEVPSDFVIESDEMLLELSIDGGSTFSTGLQKASYDDIIAFYSGQTGAPEAYALVGKYFILGPTPDSAASYVLRMRYQGRDTSVSALAAGATNQWLTHAPDLLVNHAGMSVAAFIKDAEAINVFASKYNEARQRFIVLDTAREEANRVRVMEG